MKFLCDRCRTRYSIADDRVRGKILKIRCKNCANVITVREGMIVELDGPAASEHAGRASKPTTGAPAPLGEQRSDTVPSGHELGTPGRPSDGAADPGPAGGARSPGAQPGSARPAAASDPVAKPRPAVAAPAASGKRSRRPAETERGDPPSRRRAAPEPPREDPDGGLGAAFAAAMADPPPAALEEEWYVSIDGDQEGPFSLAEAQRWVSEQSAEAELHCWSEGFDDWLSVDKVGHFRGLRKRPPPVPRAAGATRPAPSKPVGQAATVAPAAPVAPVVIDDEPAPLFTATLASLERSAPASAAPQPPVARSSNGHAVPAGARPAIGAVRSAFDTSEDDSESEPTLYRDPYKAAAHAGPAGSPPAAPVATGPAAGGSAGGSGADGKPAAVVDSASDFDSAAHGSDLDFGEVSRVLDLSDVVRGPRTLDRPGVAGPSRGTARQNAIDSFRSTGPVGAAGAGSIGRLSRTTGPDGVASFAEPEASAPVAARSHRGLFVLLGVASVLVLGAVVAVVLVLTGDDEPIGSELGPVQNIDTSRPDDPIGHRPSGAPGALDPGSQGSVRPVGPRAAPHPARPSTARDSDPVPGYALRSDEVEDVARKHQELTQRCYQRAQRGADSILVGEVKKITVTLTVDREGNVSDLGLSEHAGDNLGKCLTSSIRTGWKFRASPGGTFQLSLVFSNG